MTEKMYVLDFETFYSKTYSLTNMGPVAYCRHEEFDCYQVAVVGEEGAIFVGHPREFDWNIIRGAIPVAHNAAFDSVVFAALQRDGVIPKDIVLQEWVCTADLSVFFQGPRNLQGACRELLDGMKISKAYRNKSKGKTVQQMKDAGDWDEILAAGAGDALGSYALAKKYLPLWPAKERRISAETRKMGIRGIQIDVEKVEAAMVHIANLRQDALRLMVWADDAEDTPLSPKKIREYGRSVGIAVPASLAATSPDAKLWFETYGESHPWVLAVRDYRRLNTIYKKLKILRDEVDENGIYSFSLKYFGAGTGRFSGGGKFNLQNLPRGKLFGIDMRSFIIARPGHRLLIADHAQIEARLLLWRVSDTVSIQLIKQVGNIYVAYAIRIGRVAPGTDKKQMGPVMYLLTKSEVLGLGYGMGKAKYLTKTNQDIAAENVRMLVYAMENGLEKPEFIPLITAAEADHAVLAWRANNPMIVSYWKHQDTWLKISASRNDPTHEITLKSGRVLVYHKPTLHVSRDEKTGRESMSVTVQNTRGDTARHYYGGKLVENEIQATARDILCDGWLALIDSGRTVLFHAHDEFANEVPIDQCTTEERVEVRRLMIESSPWAEGAPLDVDLKDMKYTDCYGK